MSGSALRPAVRRATLAIGGERGYERLRAWSVTRDIRNGSWTEPELALIEHAVRDGDEVADVGANYGMWSFHLSRAVGDAGRVHAFEPVRATCSTLERVMRGLGAANVRIVAAGAGDEPGSVSFVVPRRNDGSSDTGKAWAVRSSGAADAAAVTATMIRLDDELGDVDISFMKCDVEGGELFALRGARRVAERSAPTLVLETSRPAMSKYEVTPEQLQELLEDLGYDTYRYEPGEGVLKPAVAGDRDANLIAVHPRRADRLSALLRG